MTQSFFGRAMSDPTVPKSLILSVSPYHADRNAKMSNALARQTNVRAIFLIIRRHRKSGGVGPFRK